MNQKYVIIKNGCGGETPILFDGDIAHSVFASLNPISAGFWGVDHAGNGYAYGKSVSLGLDAHEGDTRFIDRLIKKANGQA